MPHVPGQATIRVPDDQVRLSELALLSDIGQMSKLSLATLTAYRGGIGRVPLPEPWGHVGNHPVWLRTDIAAWVADRRKVLGETVAV